MTEQLSSISVAQRLRRNDFFCVTVPLLADLLNLGPRQTYLGIAQLRADGLMDDVEKVTGTCRYRRW